MKSNRPRLTTLKSTLATVPNRLKSTAQLEPKADKFGQGRGGRPWRRLRERILQRDSYVCQACAREGRTQIAHEVDHVVNIAAGGTDDPSNLEAICTDCHRKKTQQEARRG
jgi:5-methylcytosine-specific restriction protein A